MNKDYYNKNKQHVESIDNGSRWYIFFKYGNSIDINDYRYLHKDFNVKINCGAKNFFNTKEKAEKHLDKYLERFEFIKEEEMEIK